MRKKGKSDKDNPLRAASTDGVVADVKIEKAKKKHCECQFVS